MSNARARTRFLLESVMANAVPRYRKPDGTGVYWSKYANNRNFGDVLSRNLYEHYTGKRAVWVPPCKATIVVTGSILHRIPPNYGGILAGIGAMHASTRTALPNARVLAVRGELTLRAISGLSERPLLADPGLLAPDLLTEVPEKQFDVGIIRHFADRTAAPSSGHDIRIIDITWPVNRVIYEAARCSRIVSSSLHGLILADSLGMPRLWEPSSQVGGADFKFHDYSSALGTALVAGIWSTVDPDVVERLQRDLRRMFTTI